MAWAKGTAFKVSVIKAVTWQTAADADIALMQFRPTSFSWADEVEALPDASFNEDAVRRERTNTGRTKTTFSCELEMKYEGFGLVPSLFFGADTISGVGPYVHTIVRKIDMAGIFSTMEFYDGVDTHTLKSVQLTKLSFAATAGGIVTCSFEGYGSERSTATGDGIGGSLTEDTNVDYVQMISSIVTYQTAATASSLAALEVMSWNIDYERVYDSDDRQYTSTDAPFPSEACSADFNCTGSVTIPWEAKTYADAAVSGALYKLHLLHTLSATAIMAFGLPSITIESAPQEMSDKGGMTNTINFRADKAVSAPSGMDSQTVPYMIITNNDATGYLA